VAERVRTLGEFGERAQRSTGVDTHDPDISLLAAVSFSAAATASLLPWMRNRGLVSGPFNFAAFLSVLVRSDPSRRHDTARRAATEGELSSNLCSGTRWLSAGKVPAGFGRGSAPVDEVAGIKAIPEQQALAAAVWVILVLIGAGLLSSAS
jgi:hypothetical protein